jgi:heme/copper-type cytochrome/quinol oxidase subunit 2
MITALALLAVADSWTWAWGVLMTLTWMVIIVGAVWLLLIHSTTRGRRRDGHPGSSTDDWQAGGSRPTSTRRDAA